MVSVTPRVGAEVEALVFRRPQGTQGQGADHHAGGSGGEQATAGDGHGISLHPGC